jgi:hypothetical protein
MHKGHHVCTFDDNEDERIPIGMGLNFCALRRRYLLTVGLANVGSLELVVRKECRCGVDFTIGEIDRTLKSFDLRRPLFVPLIEEFLLPLYETPPT